MLRVIPKTYSHLFGLRGFRWFWIGAALSAIGDAMSVISIVWLAIELAPHNQGIAIAFASAAYLMPGVVSGAVLGKWLGGLSSRTLLLIDCSARFGFLGAIVVLHLVGFLPLGAYITLLALAAITRPVGMAGERVLLRDLVSQTEFFSANSLLGMATQMASIVGPICAGFLITLLGATNVIALDAASFGIFGLIVWMLPGGGIVRVEPSSSFSSSMPLRHLLQLRVIFWLFLLTFLFHLFYGPLVVALPLYAQLLGQQVKESGSVILGLLWSGFGIGALLGGSISGLHRSLASFTAAVTIVGLWGIAVVMISTTPFLPVAIAAMTFGGFIYAPYPAITTTIMQHRSPAELLARISSYWSSMTSVASPLGTIIAGLVVPVLGARLSLIGSGLITLGIACAFGAAKRFKWRNTLDAGDQTKEQSSI
ncbi:MAG: MFS transporter [Ktedonobacteraceae bacterium]